MLAACHGCRWLNDLAADFRDGILVRTAISQNVTEPSETFIDLANGILDKENGHLLGKLDRVRKPGLEVLRLGADQKNGNG